MVARDVEGPKGLSATWYLCLAQQISIGMASGNLLIVDDNVLSTRGISGWFQVSN